MTAPNAAEIKNLLSQQGLRPNRIRGQNFLVDPATMAFVADAARLDSNDVVLEPGAGIGNLTAELAARAGSVVSVEIDGGLYKIASERLSNLSNLCLIHGDILERGEVVSPLAVSAVREALNVTRNSRFKVVANLPYIVSTAFITSVLELDPRPVEIVAMVQKEVADRLAARPGSRDYGFLSVMVQAVARVEMLRRVPPGAFWPPPAVHSEIVRIVSDDGLRAKAGDLGRLKRVVSALFTHRRKQISGALVMTDLAPDRGKAEEILAAIGVEAKARAETLSVLQFIRLASLI